MKRSYVIAVIIASAIGLWMLSGQFSAKSQDAPEDAETLAAAPQDQFTVRARRVEARQRDADLVLRGQTQALRTVEVRAETAGRIIDLPAREGTSVAAGDVLCSLDVRDRKARLDEARAAVRQRSLEYTAAQELSGRGFRSETQAAGALAALDSAEAALKAAEIDLQNTMIRAPFDGVLDELGVEVGDLIQMGGTCGIVVDQDPFLVVTQVSEREVGLLEVGGTATAMLVTGEEVTGSVRFIGTRANPATRTFRVEIEVANKDGYMRDGVTAEIKIPVRSVSAHFITPALLTLNTGGELGVRTIETGDVVAFRPVNVIEDTGDGIWVTGLAPQTTIITVGQDFVVDGQQVTVELESDPIENSPAVLRPMVGRDSQRG